MKISLPRTLTLLIAAIALFTRLIGLYPLVVIGPDARFKERELATTSAGTNDSNVLVVGGSTSLGQEIVTSLLRRKVKHITIVSTQFNDTVTRRWIAAATREKQMRLIETDLGSLQACKTMVEEKLRHRTFDTVIFANVKRFPPPLLQGELRHTDEGVEEALASYYLSRFVILYELIVRSHMTGRKRVFSIDFPGTRMRVEPRDNINYDQDDDDDDDDVEGSYSVWKSYVEIAAFNEALMYIIAQRFEKALGIRAFSLNPGFLRSDAESDVTPLSRLVNDVLFPLCGVRTVEEYVESVFIPLFLAASLDDPEAFPGGLAFGKDGEVLRPNEFATRKECLDVLWNNSVRLMREVVDV